MATGPIAPDHESPRRITVWFRDVRVLNEYRKLAEASGGLISVNGLCELALRDALPSMRRKVADLLRVQGKRRGKRA